MVAISSRSRHRPWRRNYARTVGNIFSTVNSSPDAMAEEVRILKTPFPQARIYSATIQKSMEPVGVLFLSKGRHDDYQVVTISSISEGSPLLRRPDVFKKGRVVLAINGICVKSAKDAASIVKKTPPATSISFTLADPVMAPYCKLAVAQRWEHHPGLSFTSTRGRCLVQVSRVFPNGPFASTDGISRNSRINEGDIVVAINGVAVSKPDDADRALQRSHGDYSNLTTVYFIDAKEFRKSIIEYVLGTWASTYAPAIEVRPARKSDPAPHSLRNACYVVRYNTKDQEMCVSIDPEFQHMYNPEVSKNCTERWSKNCSFYRHIVPKFLKLYNEALELRLSPLEEVVCTKAWQHGASSGDEVATPICLVGGNRPSDASVTLTTLESIDADSPTATPRQETSSIFYGGDSDIGSAHLHLAVPDLC